MLTGQPPFDGQDRTELFHKIRSEPAVPPRQRRPAIDAKLERICLRCLEKEPTKRPASAGALAQDLHRWLQSESWAGRLWQPCHQHPILAIATGIIAVTLIALAVVRSRPDPDRPMREQQRRLVGGESVVLIGEKERPRWFRWGLGEAAIKQSSLAAGFFALDSSTPCLMELLPTVPGDGYRFKAEVRHEYSAFGEVGIAFAFTRRELSPDADAYFFALTFNDQEALIKPSKATQRCSQVSLSLRRSGQPDFLKSVQLLWKNYAPPLRTASAPWRQLVVRVAADNIEAFWDGTSIGLIRPADIARALHTLDGEMAGPESFPLSATGFPHRAAVGLFLKGGTASFQQVTVEPLR